MHMWFLVLLKLKLLILTLYEGPKGPLTGPNERDEPIEGWIVEGTALRLPKTDQAAFHLVPFAGSLTQRCR